LLLPALPAATRYRMELTGRLCTLWRYCLMHWWDNLLAQLINIILFTPLRSSLPLRSNKDETGGSTNLDI
jgi:hypothetical protein